MKQLIDMASAPGTLYGIDTTSAVERVRVCAMREPVRPKLVRGRGQRRNRRNRLTPVRPQVSLAQLAMMLEREPLNPSGISAYVPDDLWDQLAKEDA